MQFNVAAFDDGGYEKDDAIDTLYDLGLTLVTLTGTVMGMVVLFRRVYRALVGRSSHP